MHVMTQGEASVHGSAPQGYSDACCLLHEALALSSHELSDKLSCSVPSSGRVHIASRWLVPAAFSDRLPDSFITNSGQAQG